ncbi:hypothetical protein MMC12_004028 [Toensbergia leucococca]|nr:hypothetical protein [Toensbergia leucococca]
MKSAAEICFTVLLSTKWGLTSMLELHGPDEDAYRRYHADIMKWKSLAVLLSGLSIIMSTVMVVGFHYFLEGAKA